MSDDTGKCNCENLHYIARDKYRCFTRSQWPITHFNESLRPTAMHSVCQWVDASLVQRGKFKLAGLVNQNNWMFELLNSCNPLMMGPIEYRMIATLIAFKRRKKILLLGHWQLILILEKKIQLEKILSHQGNRRLKKIYQSGQLGYWKVDQPFLEKKNPKHFFN